MKNQLILFLILICPLCISGQKVNVDSLAQVIVEEKMLEKVEKHEELIKRFEWTSPAFIVPSLVFILGLGYTLFMQFWGIRNKIHSELKSEETKLIIDNLIETRLIAKIEEEINKAKLKPIHVVFAPSANQQDLISFLTDSKGFTGIKTYTTDDILSINANDIVLLANERNELKDFLPAFIKKNSVLKSKARFFYFNSTHDRWEDPTITMTNFANSRDTLASRLLETLKK